jgi:ParB/RepB/Spo0J family partition protein
MKSERLPLDRIDTGKFPLSFSSGEDISSLARSIRSVGILNPPVVFLPEGDGLYTVARGARRIRAALLLEMAEIPVRISTEAGRLEHLKAGLHENVSERTLKPSERALALTLIIREGVDEKTAISEYLPLLGESPSGASMKYLLDLAGLPGAAREAADRGELSRESVQFLAGAEAQEAVRLFDLISGFGLTLGHQRRLTETLTYLTSSGETTLTRILGAPEVAGLTSAGSPRDGRAREKLMKVFSGMRNPMLTGMEDSFRETVGEMALPAAVSISLQATFDRGGFSLKMKGRSHREEEVLMVILQ